MNHASQIAGLILAAGKGTRMGSPLPKVLHLLAGKPLVTHVFDTLIEIGLTDMCLVLGPETEPFRPLLAKHPQIAACIQHLRQGTGDAVASAAVAFQGCTPPTYTKGELISGSKLKNPYTLICYGDVPSIPPSLLNDFIEKTLASELELGVIAMRHPAPHGYGRMILDHENHLLEIIEEKDAPPHIKSIDLCNTGIVLAKTTRLFELLNGLTAENSQNEYYLTDIFKKARDKGLDTFVYISDQYQAFAGVNTKEQLANMERWVNNNSL